MEPSAYAAASTEVRLGRMGPPACCEGAAMEFIALGLRPRPDP
jgi:hypothetical protein